MGKKLAYEEEEKTLETTSVFSDDASTQKLQQYAEQIKEFAKKIRYTKNFGNFTTDGR